MPEGTHGSYNDLPARVAWVQRSDGVEARVLFNRHRLP